MVTQGGRRLAQRPDGETGQQHQAGSLEAELQHQAEDGGVDQCVHDASSAPLLAGFVDQGGQGRQVLVAQVGSRLVE